MLKMIEPKIKAVAKIKNKPFRKPPAKLSIKSDILNLSFLLEYYSE